MIYFKKSHYIFHKMEIIGDFLRYNFLISNNFKHFLLKFSLLFEIHRIIVNYRSKILE